jgi:hypothetical protein
MTITSKKSLSKAIEDGTAPGVSLADGFALFYHPPQAIHRGVLEM